MSFMFRRAYTGRLRGVVLDWAGTTLDYGCYAPAMVFVQVFEEQGVPITMEEARRPMGMYKRDHIAQITQMPAVAARWREVHGRAPGDDDVQRMFDSFVPRQMACIAQYTDLIPGVLEAVEGFRRMGLKIGSCTGYTRAMMDLVVPKAREQGFEPDALVVPGEVPAGRPAPWMALLNAMRLGIYPMEAMVKIGDTAPDVLEGLNAGMWTIAVARTGNEIGLNEAEIDALPPTELNARLNAAYEKLGQAGAHFVVDSLIDALPVLDEINRRLAVGQKP